MLTIKKLFHHLGPTLPVGIGNTIFKTNQEALLSKENIFRNMMLSNWPCFTWKFFLITFHKILKLIFQKQPSCPRNICTNHRRELSITWQLSWKFSYTLRTAILWSMCEIFCSLCHALKCTFLRFSSARVKIPLSITHSYDT